MLESITEYLKELADPANDWTDRLIHFIMGGCVVAMVLTLVLFIFALIIVTKGMLLVGLVVFYGIYRLMLFAGTFLREIDREDD